MTQPRDSAGDLAPAPFDAAQFLRLKRERGLALGDPLTALPRTVSTNDDALAAVKSGAPHGALFIAEEQTRGRGRMGHHWHSRPGDGLTFSVVLRPARSDARLSGVTLALGLAVRDAVAARLKSPVGLKWPNDVIAGGRKLAGILVESVVEQSRVSALVAGIGVNVTTRAFPEELAGLATSLALLGATDTSRELLLADVLQAVAARLQAFETEGLGTMLDEIRSYDVLFGTRVRVDGVEGIARGIGADGALLVARGESSELVSVVSGSIERP